MKITIAIDGYSSCGKSTLAKAVAKDIGYIYVDSGAMYRAATLYFIENKIDYNNKELVEKVLDDIKVSFINQNGQNRTLLNGKDVEDEIRKMYVSKEVSPVATISEVRRYLVNLQRQMGTNKGVVMDGRDIGTVVFPDAELKLFLNADMDIRAKRRFDELIEKGHHIPFQDVRKNLRERDKIDSTRKDSPLKKALDAIELDTTDASVEELMKEVKYLMQKRIMEIEIIRNLPKK